MANQYQPELSSRRVFYVGHTRPMTDYARSKDVPVPGLAVVGSSALIA